MKQRKNRFEFWWFYMKTDYFTENKAFLLVDVLYIFFLSSRKSYSHSTLLSLTSWMSCLAGDVIPWDDRIHLIFHCSLFLVCSCWRKFNLIVPSLRYTWTRRRLYFRSFISKRWEQVECFPTLRDLVLLHAIFQSWHYHWIITRQRSAMHASKYLSHPVYLNS